MLRFEQDAGELGAIGEHVVGPFERDADLRVGAVDAVLARAPRAARRREGAVERDTGDEAERGGDRRIAIGNDQEAGGEIAGGRLPGAAAAAPARGLLQRGEPDLADIAGLSGAGRLGAGRADFVEAVKSR